jgi:bifunctional NMN adenylyltransferase/nudix hydrolase
MLAPAGNGSKMTPAFITDLCVFIGRFQPFHEGHLAVVRQALKQGRFLLIAVGSAGDPRRYDYIPFTAPEREQMIRSCLTPEENARVLCAHVEDSAYNLNDWIMNIQTVAQGALSLFGLPTTAKISLIGHAKDNSSYYLKLFPQWGSLDVKNYLGLSASDFRKLYFSHDPQVQELALVKADGYIPDPVLDFLWKFRETYDYRELVAEQEFMFGYRKAWENSPYPPKFVTVDCCLVFAGNVLLIQRKARPGKGLWALPGGFLEDDEFIIDGIFRELKEETSIKVPLAVLRGSMIGEPKVFDAPFRSSRGRTITHCGLVHLQGTELPKIRAADDAADARWWPISEITRGMMFEDHYAMIQNRVSLL